MENSKYAIQSSIMNKMKTGNIIFDYLLNFLILSLITYTFHNLRHLKKKIVHLYEFLFKNKNYVEINIDAQTVHADRGGLRQSKLHYSKVFQAIVYYIKELNPQDIYSKREPDKNEKETISMFDLFIPDQDDPFILDKSKDIYCIIKLTTNEVPSEKDRPEVKKSHSIRIFSENKDTKLSDIEEFIDSCMVKYKKYIQSKTIAEQYYLCFSNSEDDGEIMNYTEKMFNTNRTFNTIFFENKDLYIKKLKFFLENEDWYVKKGIPYHYGILLHGTPGCGKTSIIKATLQYTGRNAFVIPLNRVKTCGELENIFFKTEVNGKNIPTEKRIYIFEDIDCLCNIVKNRDQENKSDNEYFESKFKELETLCKNSDSSLNKTHNKDDDLNLSCLLNIFDGILETPGRIIILTSNYPDRIDKALLRPGRIDLNIELKKTSFSIAEEMLSSFYDVEKDTINKKLKNNFSDYTISPAEIMNICLKNTDSIDDCMYDIAHYMQNV
jgi:hypothetical protein